MERGRRPRSLPCGHTFCEVCLFRIIDERRLTCPTCRSLSTFPVLELPINYVAEDLARQQQERQRRGVVCNAHPTEIVRFFCNTCGVGLCAECIVGHSGHLFVKYEESVIVLRNKSSELRHHLEETCTRLSSFRQELESALQCLRSKSQAELLKADLNFRSLLDALEARQVTVREDYVKTVQAERDKLLRESERLNELKATLQTEQEKLFNSTSLLLSDTDPRSSHLSNQLTQQLDHLRELHQPLREEPCVKVSVPEFLLFARQSREMVMGMGALMGDLQGEGEVLQPQLSFFGDKNQVMTLDLTTLVWDLRTIFSQYEFSYYAAAVTLPDGSALITGGGSFSTVLQYKDRKLVAKSSMLQVRKEHAAVYLNGYVYALGGYDGQTSHFLRDCERYSLLSDEWSPISPMNTARCAFSATAVNSRHVFIFGGYDGSQRLASIEKYDPEEDRWLLVPVALKSPLSNSACFSPKKNTVIVLGGGLSTGFSFHVQQLDVETGLWTNLPMMTEGRDLRNKVAFFSNRVYCVGGYNFKAEMLEIGKEAWDQLATYPVGDNLDSWSCALTFRRGDKKSQSLGIQAN